MSDYEWAIRKTLKLEGGYNCDHAGPTNRGILLRSLLELCLDYDGDGDTDLDDLRGMTEDQAIAYYKVRFWDFGGWGRIEATAPAWKVYDSHVLMGKAQASLILQRALHTCGGELKIDGIVGPITIRLANRTNWIVLMDGLRMEMAKTLERILQAHTDFERYRAGWMERARE